MFDLSKELYRMYTAEIYPILAVNDPHYQLSLVKSGVGWIGKQVPDRHRRSFEEEMKMQAWLGATKIQNDRSLEPATIRTKVLDGRMTLYRGAERDSKKPPSIWWFTEKVAERCREAAGPDPQKRLDWLRNILAVCYNFNKFDCLQRLVVQQGERLPAVLGKGLPMPYYKFAADRETGLFPKLPKDYWETKGKQFTAGELQIVLPWVPVRRVEKTDSL